MSKSKASAASEPVIINDCNLSRAWSRLLLRILNGAGTEVSPLVLSVTGFDDKGMAREDLAVRQALDQLLERKSRFKVDDVAFTIFPQRLWEMRRGDRYGFFALYRETFPALASDEQAESTAAACISSAWLCTAVGRAMAISWSGSCHSMARE